MIDKYPHTQPLTLPHLMFYSNYNYKHSLNLQLKYNFK